MSVSHIVINATIATEDSGAYEIGTQIVKEMLKHRDVLNADLDVVLPGAPEVKTLRADELRPGMLLHVHRGHWKINEVRPLQRPGMEDTWTYVGLADCPVTGWVEYKNDSEVQVHE